MTQLDDPLFSLTEAARIVGIPDTKLLSNWTERGLCDPHASPVIRRRGRGRQRSFSTRDLLRFALMKDLADRYAIPVPLGTRICERVLGAWSPANFGIYIVEKANASAGMAYRSEGPEDLARRLSETSRRSALLVNTEGLAIILERAEEAIRAKSAGESHG